MALKRLLRGLNESGQTEIGKIAALQSGGALDETLGLRVDTKPQSGAPTAVLLGSCCGHPCH
ncbi:MAG: hypothetical protein FWD73_09755 [Polyangiaceae bacterium]|nr:hypothetical protein [Polyangiaceae bacterium]